MGNSAILADYTELFAVNAELMKLVEKTVKNEHQHSPNKPIYLAGESLGACLALCVAARNPHIDIVLILSNPGKLNGLLTESFCLYDCMK